MKYKESRWVKSIPKGSHGTTSNPITFRYWKLVSDYTRIHDWYKYKGQCISCDRILEHWSQGQAAHFRSFGQSNSWAKYSLDNISMSCPHCNYIDDSYIGHSFGEKLKHRKGVSVIMRIDEYNNEQRGKKMHAWDIEKKMLELIKMIEELPEQPDYIRMAKSYMSNYCSHEYHISPEIRQVISGSTRPPDMDLLRAIGMLADRCVDCGRNIKNLNLLNVNESRKVRSLENKLSINQE